MSYNMYGVTTLGNTRKSVGDPNAKYDSLKDIYKRNRAALTGQRYVKDLDNTVGLTNMLIPFSPSMSQEQYLWYLSEAEWPGFTEQFARTLVSGLLRKPPQLELPEEMPEDQREEVQNWIMNQFSQDNSSLISFLDSALWEEMQNSRAFVCVNYPVTNPDEFTPDELQPYPILLAGESIINWSTHINPRSNRLELNRIVIRMFREVPSEDSPYHSDYLDTVWVHELDEQGYYQIIIFEQSKEYSASNPVISGNILQDYITNSTAQWTEIERETNILRNGERLDYIPIFPLNGEIEPREPMLTNLINREIGLYNRISRRNHLLYGSASYTPVVMANLSDDEKEDIVSSGLGSWLFLDDTGKVDVLSPPTESLTDLESSIEGTINEMARLGMRILAPETTSDQSGIALEIRNAAQTSQLATLNNKVSETMRSIITTMVNWRYASDYQENDFSFTLSADFNPAPIGADWLRLVSEWYQGGIIPRSVFIEVAKQNDILPADYVDEEGLEEIEQDPTVMNPEQQFEQDLAMMEAQAEMANNQQTEGN